MADLKNLMPHIRRAAVINGIMFVYFFSPSFLSFLAILIAVSTLAFENPLETVKSLLSCEDQCCGTKCINESFEKFKSMTIIQQLMILVLLKLAVDFIWLIPTWILIFLAVQVFSAWNFLKQLGLVQKGHQYVQLAHKSVQKAVNLIPKYQQK